MDKHLDTSQTPSLEDGVSQDVIQLMAAMQRRTDQKMKDKQEHLKEQVMTEMNCYIDKANNLVNVHTKEIQERYNIMRRDVLKFIEYKIQIELSIHKLASEWISLRQTLIEKMSTDLNSSSERIQFVNQSLHCLIQTNEEDINSNMQ